MVMEVVTMSKWDQGGGLKMEVITIFVISTLGAGEVRKMGHEGILSDYLLNYDNYVN